MLHGGKNPLSRGLGNIVKVCLITCRQSTCSMLIVEKSRILPELYRGNVHMLSLTAILMGTPEAMKHFYI